MPKRLFGTFLGNLSWYRYTRELRYTVGMLHGVIEIACACSWADLLARLGRPRLTGSHCRTAVCTLIMHVTSPYWECVIFLATTAYEHWKPRVPVYVQLSTSIYIGAIVVELQPLFNLRWVTNLRGLPLERWALDPRHPPRCWNPSPVYGDEHACAGSEWKHLNST